MAENKPVSLKFARLYPEDVALLSPGKWLNDSCIGFFFELVTSELSKEEAAASKGPFGTGEARDEAGCPSGGRDGAVLFMDPATSFWILTEDAESLEDVEDTFESLEIDQKHLILVAVNDNTDRLQTAGGTHWACLAWWRHPSSNRFVCFDSMAGGNERMARQMADRLHKVDVACRKNGQKQERKAKETQTEFRFEKGQCGQQDNCTDCGVFACMAAENLARTFLSLSSVSSTAASVATPAELRPSHAATFRQEFLSKVESIGHQQRRIA
uniref:Ubiquitin-like protease family profile domain-containing protein n=1 Tax=Chromera velia CCMP2878 TaxID=1169474 RepID=A0A0G4G0Z3_9ALVE|mmetsp:Transcript_43304/g.85445  ORF Transcript_43304/g.85445 Transcript_43304/m.85445 type:complete len:270 (-) Transcript_43304:49-858(-)|eukprot:Cvel_19703.t1-p1 / transcript=Cvel_19703.t1 / gene=Cvel_19703 / organism=Chromera_velia_CCMP2878 / gene_product=Sentrin-specific protease 8, putative / transcript_product=Sentrin-specific protease 8, putative / location=Cvel_scaffold1720:17190-21048(-) / protein_length=269 / sequence_SO=supercontig / SO=protein_coding / is_pseudo=false